MKNYLKYNYNSCTNYITFSGKIYDIVNLSYGYYYIQYYCNKDNTILSSFYLFTPRNDDLCYNNHIYTTNKDIEILKCLIEYDETIKAIDTLP